MAKWLDVDRTPKTRRDRTSRYLNDGGGVGRDDALIDAGDRTFTGNRRVLPLYATGEDAVSGEQPTAELAWGCWS